jgi:penicillin-binding protein 1C
MHIFMTHIVDFVKIFGKNIMQFSSMLFAPLRVRRSFSERLAVMSARIVLCVLLCVGLFSLFFPLDLEIPFSTLVCARDGAVMHAFLSSDDKWRMKTELSEISPTLRTTILHKEDRWFYWHIGVNPFAAARALANNIRRQKRTSGASTLTMQTARLLENARARRRNPNAVRPRTWANKLFEILRALQLEIALDKDEILQLYLNLAPYGGNIEGVKAASLLYFGAPPDKLSLAQATTLAIIPNRPTSLKLDEQRNAAIRDERDKWLRRFLADGIFPTDLAADALREPTDIRRREVPSLIAPHLAYRVRRSASSDSPLALTTIDMRKQQSVQTLVANVTRRLKQYGITNAAALVVNNRTREVEAYVGSSDYADKAAFGEVDGVRAVRSPGSALKPLVYALAFDKGFITPKSILTDVPLNFDGYAPENFDRVYRGFIAADKALINSLNIPAVKLTHAVGVAALVETLSLAGFEQIRADAGKLGLSLALGGCGVRLEELAGLYCAFANAGEWKPLQIRRSRSALSDDKAKPRGMRIISPSAAFMLGDILTQLTRPDVPRNFGSVRRLPKVAWKTGTSYGRRDAWSVGYNPRYTVAVWVGNFSGEGAPELVGASVATPLLFDIFNAVDYDSPNDWFQPPPELDFRLVCSESGLPPAETCQNQVSDYYIPRVSPSKRCECQREIMISSDERFAYCPDCLPRAGYKRKLYPNLPPDIVALYTAQGRAFERIPEHNPLCERALHRGAPPAVTSLLDGKEYILDSPSSGLALACNAAADVRKVYWFIDDKFYREAAPDERVFFTPPRKGKIVISCADDKGRSASLEITATW